jgi:DNA-binding MarR family transcriptional regulator
MNKSILGIYDSLQEIALHFGSHGINGECCDDLSFVEFMALKKIHGNNDFSIQEVGNALNFTKSGATRIINRLENKGYVAREHSPIDGRVCCVKITAKGLKVTSKITEKYAAYVEGMLEDFEPEIVDNVKNVLEMLVNSTRKQGFI